MEDSLGEKVFTYVKNLARLFANTQNSRTASFLLILIVAVVIILLATLLVFVL